MNENLKAVVRLLDGITLQGYANVKRLSTAMDILSDLLNKIDKGELVVRQREEMKHGTENCRQTD